MRNIVANAIKFTNKGGKVEISSMQKKDHILISIKDNGIGMSEANLKKLFKIEEAYSTEGTNNEKGTGLGLILCKEFIKNHKGEIAAKSKLGKGTTFNITIPNK